MEIRVFSAYNLARGVLLNSKLAIADSGHQPLKLLDIVISGMGMDATAGLWLTPLHAVPAVPRVFPFDLIYLDKEYRVLETSEMGPGIDFPLFHAEVASALILPSDTLRRSQTTSSDRLIVCLANELEALLGASTASQVNAVKTLGPSKAVAAGSTTDRLGSSVIQLTPENLPLPASAPTRGVEHSIAAAKVAEGPTATGGVVALVEPPIPPADIRRDDKIPEQPATGKRELLSPEPMEMSGADFERPRKVQAPIIEHHVDPEDLFSNWVVSPPTPPATRIERRPSPVPAPAKPKTATPVRNGKQNGTKPPASANASVEQSDSPGAAVPDPARVAAEPKTRVGSDKPAAAPKPKTDPPGRVQTPTPLPLGIPQLPPASTFTAVQYGTWQVSMPTGIAPVVAANPFSSNPAADSSARDDAKQAKSVPDTLALKTPAAAGSLPPKPASSPGTARPEPATRVVPRSSTPQPQGMVSPTPSARTESEKLESSTKPISVDRKTAEITAPGDFLASLQQKLERVQLSKPAVAPAPDPATVTRIATIQASSAPPGISKSTAQDAAAKQTPATSKLSTPTIPPSVQPANPGTGVRSEPSGSATQANIKAEPQPVSFRSRFRQWLNPLASPSDRRKALRRYVPGVVAHYFTGGAPTPKDVADISMSGMYLLTDDHWMPGTMIQMTLQKPCARGERKQSINVLSRIVRRGADGVAIEFIMPEALSHISHDIQPSQATDKFALARFL